MNSGVSDSVYGVHPTLLCHGMLVQHVCVCSSVLVSLSAWLMPWNTGTSVEVRSRWGRLNPSCHERFLSLCIYTYPSMHRSYPCKHIGTPFCTRCLFAHTILPEMLYHRSVTHKHTISGRDTQALHRCFQKATRVPKEGSE